MKGKSFFLKLIRFKNNFCPDNMIFVHQATPYKKTLALMLMLVMTAFMIEASSVNLFNSASSDDAPKRRDGGENRVSLAKHVYEAVSLTSWSPNVRGPLPYTGGYDKQVAKNAARIVTGSHIEIGNQKGRVDLNNGSLFKAPHSHECNQFFEIVELRTNRKNVRQYENLEEVLVSKLKTRLALIDPFFDINAPSVRSLYSAFSDLVIPVKAAFELKNETSQQLIISKFLETLSCAVTLGELRKLAGHSAVVLDTNLVHSEIGGPDSMQIFPVYGIDRRTSAMSVGENRLNQLQFCGLLSYTLKQLHLKYSNSYIPPSELEIRYNEKCFPMLLEMTLAYWNSVRWGPWSKDYHPSMKVRTHRILNMTPHSFPEDHAHYRAFTDVDNFVLHVAADLLFVNNNMAPSLKIGISSSKVSILLEIRDLTRKIMEHRLIDSDYDGFVLEPGLWKDHPDFSFAGYYGAERPDPTICPPHKLDDVASDISHSFRWPLWLESYRDSWIEPRPTEKSTDMRNYYDSLRTRLANQIATHVLTYTPDGVPLGTNYINGNNGWYRVNYLNGAYGPFGLTVALPRGTYYLLGPIDSRIRQMGRAYGALMEATDLEVIKTRNKYYGPNFNTSNYRYFIYQLSLALRLL